MLAVLLFAIGLVLFNREAVSRILKGNRYLENMIGKDTPPAAAPAKQPAAPVKPETAPQAAPSVPPKPTQPVGSDKTEQPSARTPAAEKTEPTPMKPSQPDSSQNPGTKPAADANAVEKTQPEKTSPDKKPSAPAAALKNDPAKSPAPKQPSAKPPAAAAKPDTRPRVLWFVRVENDGLLSRVKATRSLPVTDTPLVDALAALMAGPENGEKKKGYSSLIPEGAKLLSATVRGTTAYLSFNEAFQFNSYGIEGFAAQLRQIVWTATEFESVKDVQILIEGRRVDYLGSEGIFIGSPLNRESL